LSLANNKFSGCISTDYFDGMNSLNTLDISRNNLCGNLPALIGTNKLKTINFSFNLFTGGVPISWSLYLQNLLSCDLKYNSLIGPIVELSKLSKVKYVDLSHNSITNDLSNPFTSIYGEVFSGCDAAIGQSLIELHLDYNNITGTWIGLQFYPYTLSIYTLSHNQIKNLPNRLFAQEIWFVKNFDVSYNALT
jgi:hypothetical protein